MSTLLTITEFIGRFHPVMVHLPIGILLMAVVFYFIAVKGKAGDFNVAIRYSLIFGIAAGVFSCITGYLLSVSGEYDEGVVSKHQWLGIATTVLAAATYYFFVKKSNMVKWLMPLVALFIVITGHLGGSLTHGDDYLTQALPSSQNNFVRKPIPNIQQAVVYSDIVQPILQSKCYSCHGPAKQKGKLRLDEPPFIDKGGEEGKIIIAGKAGESEMIKRLLLPLDNKDHMPPKQKPQLSKGEIELLNWWVATGAGYHQKTAELNQPEKIKPYLVALQSGNAANETTLSDLPEDKVDAAPASAIKKLRALNVAVNNVAQNSNYLSVNFVAVDSVTTQHSQLLRQIGKQIAWLKMGNTKINDSVMSVVGELPSLTRLFLNNSNATDKSIAYLNNLSKLQYLNVSSTAVTAKGASGLTGLKNLKQLYLYKTGVDAAGFAGLKKIFSSAVIDTGGYTVQFLPTDTMLVKEKPKKG